MVCNYRTLEALGHGCVHYNHIRRGSSSRLVQEPSFQVIPRLSYKGMQVSVIGSLRYSICTTKYLCGLIFMDV